MNIFAGDIVYSKAGRDAGKTLVVLSVVDENFVMLADGRLRKVDTPKKKKVKHLEKTGYKAEAVAEKLKEGLRVTNPDLKRALAELTTDIDA